MSTATDTGTDLDWVRFTSEDHDEVCGYRGCQSHATHAGIFAVFKPCTHTRMPYCLTHREVILRDARKADGLFMCRICGPGSVVHLLRIEALR